MSVAPSVVELRLKFFDYLFEEREGFLCIAHLPKQRPKKDFREKFFVWPEQREVVGHYIEQIKQGNNVWYGVNLYRRPQRKRDFALPTRLVWADLDYCNPGEVNPAPQCRIESSPRKYQAIWRLEELVDPIQAQTFAKRIAYAYADKGADKSGWDIEQVLRVPYTHNYKYDDGQTYVPEVKLLLSVEALLPVEVFAGIVEPIPEEKLEVVEGMPNVLSLPEPEQIIYAHRNALRKTSFYDLYAEEPTADWSASMWHLLNICLEVGMDKEETFSIALSSKCNKYDRDDRPISYLWREILKADLKQKQITAIIGEPSPLLMPKLYEGDPPETIIDKYKDWAVEATDAVEEYHELAVMILLSSLTASSIYLNTSFGKVIPNLWGLILGDSTLTRKTTAMKMVMEFLHDIDQDAVVATDGSVEGILTAMAGRPEMVSVFFKDEVSGFLDAINKKDYLAGMPETLTKLYDADEFFVRRLRKETITITKPVFIFFGGGIRDKMYGILNDQYILSGFLPRFLIVGGDADLNKIRPASPLIPEVGEKRRKLREFFQELSITYSAEAKIEIPGGHFTVPTSTEVMLTDEAWEYFQQIQMQLAKAAAESSFAMVAQPTFDRLAWSALKMAMLFSTTTQEPNDGKITVSKTDLEAAAYYIQKWAPHVIDLITNVGRSADQRLVTRVYEHVKRRPGVTRSELSRHHHLNKKQLDLVLETLVDRGQVNVTKQGNGSFINPL